MTSKQFDPNGVGLKNGQFLGLPYSREEAEVVLQPVPWDVTVSYRDGTIKGPEQLIEASSQLDLWSPIFPDATDLRLFTEDYDEGWRKKAEQLRVLAKEVIAHQEAGEALENSESMKTHIRRINEESKSFHQFLEKQTLGALSEGKASFLVGGDHSTPLGHIRAHAQHMSQGFDILHIDAHADLRPAYEGFEMSHASIMHNILEEGLCRQLIQVGIRDLCQQEVEKIEQDSRIHCFYDYDIYLRSLKGESWQQICQEIVEKLDERVYLSFDIDGLDPRYCPNTGTPVVGGLEYNQFLALLSTLLASGRKLVGADLVEVGSPKNGNDDWDANVGARVAFQIALALQSSRL